jgi:hypothetical protein
LFATFDYFLHHARLFRIKYTMLNPLHAAKMFAVFFTAFAAIVGWILSRPSVADPLASLPPKKEPHSQSERLLLGNMLVAALGAQSLVGLPHEAQYSFNRKESSARQQP